MFYNPSQCFRRYLHDDRGDICLFVEVEPALLAELLDGEPRFEFAHAPADAGTYLLQDAVARALRDDFDALFVEEALLEVTRRALDQGMSFHGLRSPQRRRQTEVDHARLVEAAKASLTSAPTSRVTLAVLARSLHTSAFHLARVFRERTGFTIHGYRNQLRLRIALDRLHEGSELAELALDLGFGSHSHFTTAFRSCFGVPPSAVRALGRRGVRELRTIVEAPLA